MSAFESWKALAQNSDALALAVFRLSFDSEFCRRISNELAVIWETITVDTWLKARERYQKNLIEQGVPEAVCEELLSERVAAVYSVVPCFQYLAPYFKDPKEANLQSVPYSAMRGWFDDLRRNHSDDHGWPELFADELDRWIQKQSFPSEIQNLPNVDFSKAVAYLPIFMAAVTAGKADFDAFTNKIAELRFAVRVLTDFDRERWYLPAYSLMLSNLLLDSQNKESR